MSYHVVEWVLAHSPVDVAAQRLVLVVMAEKAGHDGREVWCSNATLAKRAKLDVRTVQRSLQALAKGGHIEQTGWHESGTRIWRVVMERGDDFRAANWSGEQQATAPPKQWPPPRPKDPSDRADLLLDPDPNGGRQDATPGNAPPLATRHPPGRKPPEPSEPSSSSEIAIAQADGFNGSPGNLPPRQPAIPRIEEAWSTARDRLAAETQDARAALWLDPLEFVSGDDGHIVLRAPALQAAALERDWTPAISDALAEAMGSRPTVHIVAAPEPEPEPLMPEWLHEAGPEAAGRPSPGSGSTVPAAREGAP